MDKPIAKEEISRRRRRKLIGAGIIVLAVVALIFGASMVMRPSVKRADVRLAAADRGTIQSTANATGRVVPAFEEFINSPIATRIVEVYCKPGDSVAAGTPLLRLDLENTENELGKLNDQIAMNRHLQEQQRAQNATQLSDLEMQIKVKAMAVERLAVELRNEKYLDSLGSGTGDRVRQVELALATGRLELEQMRVRLENERRSADAAVQVRTLELNVSQKNLDAMRRTLDDARVRAPRAGTVTYITDQPGQQVAQGERIAVLSDLGHFRVDAEIADAYTDRLAAGARAVVRIGREDYDATVSRVAPKSENSVIAFSLRLDRDNAPRLRSGLKCDVYVMCDVMDDVLRIPNGSYYTGPGEYELFVETSAGTLERRRVSLGQASYEFVEVKDGLAEGDKVVISDMKKYKDNQKVSIK